MIQEIDFAIAANVLEASPKITNTIGNKYDRMGARMRPISAPSARPARVTVPRLWRATVDGLKPDLQSGLQCAARVAAAHPVEEVLRSADPLPSALEAVVVATMDSAPDTALPSFVCVVIQPPLARVLFVLREQSCNWLQHRSPF
jgi:hypothetical protein